MTDCDAGTVQVTFSSYGTYTIPICPPVTVDDLLTLLGHSPSLYLAWINGQLYPGSTGLKGGDEVLIRPVRSHPVLRKPAKIASMAEGNPLTISKKVKDSPVCDLCEEKKGVTERLVLVPPLRGHLHLCASCFCKLIEQEVLRTILWWNLLEPTDHIMIPVSGEKDSMCTLYMLALFQEYYPDTVLTACIVDEGMGEYSAQRISVVTHLADRLNVPLQAVSFKKTTGYTLLELITTAQESTQGLQHRPCYLCNVLKENLLQAVAHECGATKIALSRNYNDRVNAILQGVLLQDYTAMGNAEIKGTLATFNLPCISVIAELSEKDITTYLYLSDITFHWHDTHECPYSEFSIIGHMNYLISDLEAVSPGVSNYIMSGYTRYLQRMTSSQRGLPRYSHCTQCGVQFPAQDTDASLCAACQALAVYDIHR